MIVAGNTLCKVVTNITTMPYIKGHITDNAETFTFKVNDSNVTVNDIEFQVEAKKIISIEKNEKK